MHALPDSVQLSCVVPTAVMTAASADALAGVVDFLEGVPVRMEERGVHGAVGYYRRLVVTCPLHCEVGKAPGRVRRNTGARQTAKLVVQWPLAYLGAWLIPGPDFATRVAHVAYKPSDAESRGYAQSRNML